LVARLYMDPKIGKQGGWVGMIVLLLAVLIVAYLAKDALVKYGMLGGPETADSRPGTPGERTRSPAAGVGGRRGGGGRGRADRRLRRDARAGVGARPGPGPAGHAAEGKRKARRRVLNDR